MLVPEFYLKPDLPLDELNKVSTELAFSNHEVTLQIIDKVLGFHNSYHGGVASMQLAQSYWKPDFLPKSLRQQWSSDQNRLHNLLRHKLGYIKQVDIIDLKLSEHLPFVDQFNNIVDILYYWRNVEERHAYFLTEKAHSKLGTMRYSMYSLVESRILNKAMKGQYLLPQIPG